MTTTTRNRRRLTPAVGVACLAVLLSACQNVWGVRESYRNYIAGPVANGELVASNGANHPEGGSGSGGGAFTWKLRSSTFDAATTTGTVQLEGTVETRGHHKTGDVWILDATFSNPRLVINGSTGTFYVDVTFRPYQGINPNPVPAKQTVNDLAFATVDLSGVDWTPNEDGRRTISNAPMVGIPAAMQLIGWDLFYGNPVTLDPLSVTF
ncbi:MAG: HtaA domain-containing protein [Actinobacteria bacterium]|nr:HtaA domain-containing protein [Actinomycetota bacterium]